MHGIFDANPRIFILAIRRPCCMQNFDAYVHNGKWQFWGLTGLLYAQKGCGRTHGKWTRWSFNMEWIVSFVGHRLSCCFHPSCHKRSLENPLRRKGFAISRRFQCLPIPSYTFFENVKIIVLMWKCATIFRNQLSSIIWGLSASIPWIWYASLFTKPRVRYQPFRANSKISYKVGNWHLWHPLRRKTAATGLPSLWRQRADLITAF